MFLMTRLFSTENGWETADTLVWVAEVSVNNSQSAVVSKHLRRFTHLADISRDNFIF